jgi:manganese-dependent inorganic pyrophosphatase
MQGKYYVVGHKNPDTDSICSAIALAYLKNQTEDGTYSAKRAGQINEETEFVLSYFGMNPPGYMPDVGSQVKDMEIRKTIGMSKDISVRKVWEYMRENQVMTVAVTNEENELEGVISMSDISNSLMVQNATALSEAKTPFKHIAETLDGEIIVGDADSCFTKGKVFIGAGNADVVKKYMVPGDLVILGNRAEDHLNAIELGAGCLVIAFGAEISPAIQNYAKEKGCVIIRTPHDSYAIAQMIEQSIPARAIMVSEGLVTFHMDDFTDKVKVIMGKTEFETSQSLIRMINMWEQYPEEIY